MKTYCTNSTKDDNETFDIWGFNTETKKKENCAVENFMNNLPEQDKDKPFLLYCPCRKCSPHC